MPYKRRYRKRKRRSVQPHNALGPLRVKQVAKLMYNDLGLALDPSVGTVADYIFSTNGVYDPNISAGGHQPRGFDQLMELYDHCTVIGCKATVYAENTDTTNGAFVGLCVRDSFTPITDARDVLEDRYVKVKNLAPAGSGPSSGTLSIKLNPNKFLGRSNPLANDDLRSSSSSNPNEQAYLHVVGGSIGNVNNQPIDFMIRLEYTVVFTEPKQPALS